MEAKTKGSESPSRMLTSVQAAKALRVSTHTVLSHARRGLLHPTFIGRRAFFDPTEVGELAEILGSRFDLVSVALMARRALAHAQMADRKFTELCELMGFMPIAMPTDKNAVLSFYNRAKSALSSPPSTDAAAVTFLSKSLLAMTESYLSIVADATGDQEPWRVFMDLATHYCEHPPRDLFAHEYLLAAAYGYMEAARRHMRPLAYFYVRQEHGHKIANKAFSMEASYNDPVLRALFPH